MCCFKNIIKSFKYKDTLWSINRIRWRREAEYAFTVDHQFSTDEVYLHM